MIEIFNCHRDNASEEYSQAFKSHNPSTKKISILTNPDETAALKQRNIERMAKLKQALEL